MLNQITPVILTYNEAPNIGRTLDRLSWARDIVVVDSLSDDGTLEIISAFPNVRVYLRPFDNFASQWSFAVQQTEVRTEWILGLDADMLVSDNFVAELEALRPSENVAYRAPLTYCVYGKPLRSSLLPSLTVLYRRDATQFSADGHTYQIVLDGPVATLRSNVLHDDRKSLRRWYEAQCGYMQLEAAKLLAVDRQSLNFADRIRRLRVVAPASIFLYCLVKGGLFDGWSGIYYATQRAFAELMLSLYLIEHDLQLRDINRKDLTEENRPHPTPMTASQPADTAPAS